MMLTWINHLRPTFIGALVDEDESDLFRAALLKEALASSRTLSHIDHSCADREWVGDASLHSFGEAMKNWWGAFPVWRHTNESEEVVFWVWETGFLRLVHDKDGLPPAVTAYSLHLGDLDKLEEWLFTHTEKVEPPKKDGHVVKALLRHASGNYDITTITRLVAPFQPQNYTEEVVEGFHYVCKELNRSDPYGRITILDGPPGTGKTWLIRAIIHHNFNCNFVIIPPDMISELSKPSILPILLQRRGKSTQPLVLILEDADQMLSQRMAENMNDITSALNMGDGILGDALNLRILASTNQPLEYIDEAMRRPGRLSRRIEVGPLSRERAKSLYASLGGSDPQTLTSESYTLAEVYTLAKKEED